MSELTASGIDEVDELSSLPHLKPGEPHCPSTLKVYGRHHTWNGSRDKPTAARHCKHAQQVTISRVIVAASGLHQAGLDHAGVFTTKSQYKRAHKKREKLARRAGRAAPGAKPGQQSRLGPDSPATPMVTETSFAFGSFEQHTTGRSSACLTLPACTLCPCICSTLPQAVKGLALIAAVHCQATRG